MSKTLIYLLLIFALWCYISFSKKAKAKTKDGTGGETSLSGNNSYSGGGTGGGSR